MDNPWAFAALLIVALLLSSGLSYLQHRAYVRTVREMAAAHNEHGIQLVSGRGKSFLRGAVVVLAVNVQTKRIIEARTMSGSTVIARFHRDDSLVGPMRRVLRETENPHVANAIKQALAQLSTTRSTADSTAARSTEGRTR